MASYGGLRGVAPHIPFVPQGNFATTTKLTAIFSYEKSNEDQKITEMYEGTGNSMELRASW